MSLLEVTSFDTDIYIHTGNTELRIVSTKKINLLECVEDSANKIVDVLQNNQSHIEKHLGRKIKRIDLETEADILERVMYYNYEKLDNLILFIENPQYNTETLQKLVEILELHVELEIKVMIIATEINSQLAVFKSNSNVNIMQIKSRKNQGRDIICLMDGERLAN